LIWILRTLENLEEGITGKTIAVMPDFFTDRILTFKSQKQLLGALSEKSKHGGGALRGISSIDVRGGNAINIAYCLAKLGAQVRLFTIADEIGYLTLKKIFSKFGNNVDLRVVVGKHGRTTALEFVGKNEPRINLIISDVGDIIDFGPQRINSESDLVTLSKCDAVMVVNWASNLKGTQLARHAFKESPKAIHFVDPADIESRRDEFKNDLLKLATFIDVLSLNENECMSLGKASGFASLLPHNNYNGNDLKNAAKKLASKFRMAVEIHTSKGASWSDGSETSFVRAIKVKPKTLTGAGDSWDAANILAHLLELEPTERLIFSNAYSALYVMSSDREPTTLDKLLKYINQKYKNIK
jgi:ribokinase